MKLTEVLKELNNWDKVDNQEEIVKILNLIIEKSEEINLLHGNGDISFYGADAIGDEIELYDSKNSILSTIQMKVRNLQCYQGGIVRMELGNAKPLSEKPSIDREEFVVLPSGEVIDRYYWDSGWYNEEPLPHDSKIVERYLNGNIVIIPKQLIIRGFRDFEKLTSATKKEFEEIIFNK